MGILTAFSLPTHSVRPGVVFIILLPPRARGSAQATLIGCPGADYHNGPASCTLARCTRFTQSTGAVYRHQVVDNDQEHFPNNLVYVSLHKQRAYCPNVARIVSVGNNALFHSYLYCVRTEDLDEILARHVRSEIFWCPSTPDLWKARLSRGKSTLLIPHAAMQQVLTSAMSFLFCSGVLFPCKANCSAVPEGNPVSLADTFLKNRRRQARGTTQMALRRVTITHAFEPTAGALVARVGFPVL